jgi:hypothetical protein
VMKKAVRFENWNSFVLYFRSIFKIM